MTEKAKVDKVTQASITPLNFFLLWLIASIGMTYLAAGISTWLMSFGFIEKLFFGEMWRLALASGLLSGSGVALAQKYVLRLAFGRSFNGWIWASFLGVVLGNLPLMILYQFNLQNLMFYQVQPYGIVIQFIGAILFALPQSWILRRYVQNSWLFALSNVIGTVLSSFIISNIASSSYVSDFASLSVVGLRSAFLALTMLWFFRGMYQPQNIIEKSQNENHKRLEDRLSEDLLLDEQELSLKEASEVL